MRIENAQQGTVRILRLEGDVDEEGVNALRIELLHCIREGQRNVVLNLSGVRLMSYMGIGVLVERLRQLRTFGGDLKLTGVSVYLERLFRMVAVSSLFEMHDSENQAVQAFREAA